jgi:hypothetical protein
MSRKLFSLAALASAVLCIGTCVLWVRSYWQQDSIEVQTRTRRVTVLSTGGGWVVEWFGFAPLPHGISWQWRSEPEPPSFRAFVRPEGFYRAGFGYRRLGVMGLAVHDLAWPSWSVALLMLATPAVWLALHLRRLRMVKRTCARLCSSCGYDLRATPDRCPECGVIPAAGGLPGGDRRRGGGGL